VDRLQRQINAKRLFYNRSGSPERWSLSELQADKKMLKHLLANVENQLKRKSGLAQLPKTLKEPYRPIYQQYKQVKALLSNKSPPQSNEAISPLDSKRSLKSAPSVGEQNPGPGRLSQTEVRSEMIEKMKSEKRMLQLKLTKFEKEFETLKGRSIKFARDIAPVRAEWIRYKALKTELAVLDPGGSSS
jgi:hypothetical protein